MKTVFNVILTVCVLVLIYICYASIMGPINFDAEKDVRDKAVQARLLDIRKAQAEFRNLNGQKYTDNFDSLIAFVKTQKLPFIYKQGELTDEQQVKKQGLEGFTRDTMWVAVLDTIFPKGFNADSMRYIPYGNGAQFEMDTVTQITKSGAPVSLLEVRAPYDVYLNGLNKQEIINLKDMQAKMNKYLGLKIGDLVTPNNNAGNWE